MNPLHHLHLLLRDDVLQLLNLTQKGLLQLLFVLLFSSEEHAHLQVLVVDNQQLQRVVQLSQLDLCLHTPLLDYTIVVPLLDKTGNLFVLALPLIHTTHSNSDSLLQCCYLLLPSLLCCFVLIRSPADSLKL